MATPTKPATRRTKGTPDVAEDLRPIRVLPGFALVCRHCAHRFPHQPTTADLEAHYQYLHAGSVQVIIAPVCQKCDGRVTYSHSTDGGRRHHYGCPTCHRARIVRSGA